MKRGGKLFLALHVLAHLAAAPARPLTSEQLAACLRTNPVVVRRSLAGLRDAGIVSSAKGHGGGWVVARPPATISLGEVSLALGERIVPAPERQPDGSGCLIEAMVGRALDGAYAEAELLLQRRLDAISLADLAADVQRRLTEIGGAPGAMPVVGPDTHHELRARRHRTE